MTRIRWLAWILSSAPFQSLADPALPISTVHGPTLIIEYRIHDSGRHELLPYERVGQRSNGKPLWQPRPGLEFDLGAGEHLTSAWGFRCFTQSREYAYGVVTAAIARKDRVFHPLRAWSVNEKEIRISPVTNPAKVICLWAPERESTYPF